MIKIPVVKKLLVGAMFYGIVLFAPAPHVCRASSQDLSQAASSPAPPAEAAAPNPVPSPEGRKPRLEITWENRLLTLDATETDIRDVIKAVSEKTGVAIDIYEGVSGKVSLHEEKAPTEKVVDDLLAAIGQRNYLMVFDGGGLTKMSIVPKGSGGGLSDAAKRVKVKGRLRPENIYHSFGKSYYRDSDKEYAGERSANEIEYYPGEILVLTQRRDDPKDERRIAGLIKELEDKHDLRLIKRTAFYSLAILKLRVLGGRDVLDVIYELRGKDITGATPNGLGPRSLEVPDEDFNVDRKLSNEELRNCDSRGLRGDECRMEKMPWLKKDWPPGRVLPRRFIEGWYGGGEFNKNLRVCNEEGCLATEGSLYFMDVRGAKEYWEKLEELKRKYSIGYPVTWRESY